MNMMTLDNERLGIYLSGRLEVPITVTSLKRSFPGASRHTYLVKALVSGQEQGFVLRVDPPEGSSFPTSLKQEWEVYRRLYGSEVPVAEPLWYDEGIDFLDGRPHMIRRLVEGSPVIPGLSDPGAKGDALRRKIAFECVENLARVHLLDWKARGFDKVLPAPSTPGDALAADFKLWRGYWDRNLPAPEPVIEEALCWMEENIPTDTPFVSLVKGNNGVGEEIFRDHRIVAMSDWEGAALADGVIDLFWSQGTLELIGFDEAMRHYEKCVGRSVSVERMTFARLLIFVKAIVCLRCYLYGNFAAGRTTQPSGPAFLISYSAEVEHQLASCIGKQLTEVWHLIGHGARNLYSTMGGNKS
jgi:aminoglycoside phosphotransferase (APT) family kinase protein